VFSEEPTNIRPGAEVSIEDFRTNQEKPEEKSAFQATHLTKN
jgi:hypothetical protein